MYPNQPPPFEQPTGRDRPGGWQPVADADEFDRHLSEPTRVHRAVDPELSPESRGFPAAPAQPTRIYPAVGTPGPGDDADYPGRPVSPAEPMSGGQYYDGVASPAGHTTGGTQAGYATGSGHAGYAASAQPSYAAGAAQVYSNAATQVGHPAARSRSTGSGSGSGVRGGVPAELRISLGTALTGIGGLLVVLFSFAPFIRYDNPGGVQRLAGKKVPVWFSAWSPDTFLAPLTWWALLAALGLVAIVALRLSGMREDREFLGFRASQLQVVLGSLGFLVLVGYAFSSKSLVFGSQVQDAVTGKLLAGDISLAWGGYLMLIGSLAAVVGAFLDHLGVGPAIWPAPAKPSGSRPRRGYDRPGYRYEPPAGSYPTHQPASYDQRSNHYGR